MLVRNPETGDEYTIRSIPLQEAHELRKRGVVMYDYTKLTAINTCPTWGVLRYGLHKTDLPLSGGGRNLAIECGSACHDFFAALRMWTLLQEPIDNHYPIMEHGKRLFGAERWNNMLTVSQDGDRINNAQRFALTALHSTGYYDDPSDKRRTMAHMDSSCLMYSDRYFKQDLPVHVKGDLIGVEIPFVLEVTDPDGWVAYYCGRIDGVHKDANELIVGENKTSARLSDVWRMSFAISQQITGYTIAASCIFEEEIWRALVMGVQIPLPRDAFLGTNFELCTRTESDRVRWCEWFFQGVGTYEAWLPKPTYAPRYSHSCNRYFSACQFIPFCTLGREEQTQTLEDMRVDEWSPLDHISEAEGPE